MKNLIFSLSAASLVFFSLACTQDNPLSPASSFYTGPFRAQFVKAAIVVYTAANGSIIRANVSNGGDVKTLAVTNTYGNALSFKALTPDEKYVLFRGRKQGESNALFRIDADGLNERRFTQDSATMSYMLTASFINDNRLIIREQPAGSALYDYQYAVYSIDAVRGDAIVNDPAGSATNIGGVFPSADGSAVFYNRRITAGITNTFEFVRYNTGTRTETSLSSFTLTNLSGQLSMTVSPDAGQILCYYALASGTAGQRFIRTMSASAPGTAAEAGSFTVASPAVLWWVTWSPYSDCAYAFYAADGSCETGLLSITTGLMSRVKTVTAADVASSYAANDSFGRAYFIGTNAPPNAPVTLW
ncbi:MAG: hypothetical protein HZC28_00115 [Spirochaetes bacterium]|nr:hypothetical protein [Spirochaetota bacterium]